MLFRSYAEFKSSGATYKIWLEEETSLKKKLEVVKKSKTADSIRHQKVLFPSGDGRQEGNGSRKLKTG